MWITRLESIPVIHGTFYDNLRERNLTINIHMHYWHRLDSQWLKTFKNCLATNMTFTKTCIGIGIMQNNKRKENYQGWTFSEEAIVGNNLYIISHFNYPIESACRLHLYWICLLKIFFDKNWLMMSDVTVEVFPFFSAPLDGFMTCRFLKTKTKYVQILVDCGRRKSSFAFITY